MRKVIPLFLISVLMMTVGLGCSSSKTKTVTTETTAYPDGRNTVQKETTVTTPPATGSSGGVLSGTVNAVGEVVALPFRAVGGLLRIIF